MVDPTPTSENSDASAAITGAVNTAKDAVATIGAKAKASATEAVDAAKHELNVAKGDIAARVNDGSAVAADNLSKLADKLAEARPDLDRSLIGGLVQQTESSLRSAASYLNDSTPDAYLTDLTSFARRNPALAMGSAIAIGFLIARAAKVAWKDLGS